jgi:aldehyde:ferredoxin oxidoreductase
MLNAKYGWKLTCDDVSTLGQRILATEIDFNRRAGITEAADRLPDYFTDETLPPHNTHFDITPEELDTVHNYIKK